MQSWMLLRCSFNIINYNTYPPTFTSSSNKDLSTFEQACPRKSKTIHKPSGDQLWSLNIGLLQNIHSFLSCSAKNLLQDRHCGKSDNRYYLSAQSSCDYILPNLWGPEDHSRWEVITLPPVGHLVGLPDSLAGGTHFDRMFYWLRGWLDRMGGLFELWVEMGGQTHSTHAGIA